MHTNGKIIAVLLMLFVVVALGFVSFFVRTTPVETKSRVPSGEDLPKDRPTEVLN